MDYLSDGDYAEGSGYSHSHSDAHQDTLETHADTEGGAPGRKRVTVACEGCKQARRKCNGQNPCEFCQKRKIECIYEQAKKRGPKSVSCVPARIMCEGVLRALTGSSAGPTNRR